MDRKHHGPQKKLTRRLSLWQHPQWRMSSLAGVPTCWKTKQCDIDCTPTCHCWHHGGAIPRTGVLASASPMGNCVPYTRPGCKEEDGDRRRSLPVHGLCPASSVQKAPACREAVCCPHTTQTGTQTQSTPGVGSEQTRQLRT